MRAIQTENGLVKRCWKCQQEKLLVGENFHKHKYTKDGFSAMCKSCNSEYNKEYKQRDREKYLEQRKQNYQLNKEKRVSDAKLYREKNPQKVKESNKKSKIKHAEKNKIKLKERRQTSEYKDWVKRNYQNKKITNLNYMIRARIATRTRDMIKKGGGIKAHKTEELLGCTIEFAKNYIISLFTEGMTWEKLLNAEIEIDHKIPVTCFDLTKEEEQRKCFHYTNLQPLWWKDNSAKRLEDIKLRKFQDSLCRDIDFFLS